MNPDFLRIENALPDETCDFLSSTAYQHPKVFKNGDQQAIPEFIDRTLSYKKVHRSMPPPWSHFERGMNYARFYAQKQIMEHWGVWCVPDNTELTIWGPGDSMSLHADNCWQPELPEEVTSETHPTWYRKYSAIFYLTGGIEGGEFYFKNFGEDISPQQGLMLAFPSGIEYTHGVREILSGIRYTIAVWLTDVLEYAE